MLLITYLNLFELEEIMFPKNSKSKQFLCNSHTFEDTVTSTWCFAHLWRRF